MVNDFLIFGAGISGLTLGLELLKVGCSVRILEASDSPGGLAKSVIINGNTMNYASFGDFVDLDVDVTITVSISTIRWHCPICSLTRIRTPKKDVNRRKKCSKPVYVEKYDDCSNPYFHKDKTRVRPKPSFRKGNTKKHAM